jgi:hypothetical protein
MASRALPILFLALAACGGAPQHAPAVLEIPPVAGTPPPAPDPGCGEAEALVARARAAEEGKRERCAARAAKEALRLCPSREAMRRVAARDDAWREKHGAVRFLGPWLLEWIEGSQEHRVWEVASGAPRLRARIESWDIAVGARDRLRVVVDRDLAFVDPAAGTVVRADGESFVLEGRAHVFVGDEKRVRRLRLSDLAEVGAVAWSEAHGGDGSRALRNEEVLVAGDVLVSFERGSVLREGVNFAGVRPDEARILACDQAGPAMIEVDVTTGAELARFALPKDMECAVAAPAYGPDPRYAFWIERGHETQDRGDAIVVAAGDTLTGKVHRFEDRSATWSIAFHSREHLDEDGRRLCAELSSFHGGWPVCEWKLTKDGHVVRDPKRSPGATPSLAALGLAGAVELGRVWTPAHDRLLVLTFREKGEVKRDLRLTVAGASGKVERTVVLQAADVLFEDNALRQAWRAHEYAPLPSVELIDGGHAVFHHGAGPMEDMLVDLGTGAVTKPCSGHDGCELVGRFAADGKGGLRDLVTGRALTLSASVADWDAVAEVAPPCP